LAEPEELAGTAGMAVEEEGVAVQVVQVAEEVVRVAQVQRNRNPHRKNE